MAEAISAHMIESSDHDGPLARARDIIGAAQAGDRPRPRIETVFDEATNTASHVVVDPAAGVCAIVDSVLDYCPASGRTGTGSADRLAAIVAANGWTVVSHLETHIHADHLTAAPLLQKRFGGEIAIGARVAEVQAVFGRAFNAGPELSRAGREFDRLFTDGDAFSIGGLEAVALSTPGHTPACTTFVIGDAAFVGDTLFMPDFGTARCDFPGGDARALYRSIRRVLALPGETRLLLCHDYKAPGRNAYVWETTVAAERAGNIHVRDGIEEDAFVALRTARDATLAPPRLLLPSVQVNMRAGRLPEPEANGVRYLKMPLDAF